MGIKDFYNRDEYIEETEPVSEDVSIGKDPSSVNTDYAGIWNDNPYNTTPGNTVYDEVDDFIPETPPTSYTEVEVVEDTIITDYDTATFQDLAEDGATFFAIMKDGTEVQVDWTEIRALPEAIREETIDLVADIMNAPEQYFWTDELGVHIAEEQRESWENSVEDNFSDYNAITKPHHNMLMNSQGFLFRKALYNLSVMTSASVAFYDGQGNTANNIRALFGAQMAQIGKATSDHVIIDAQGVTAYKGDGSLHELIGIVDGANLKNATITGSKIASSTIENSNIKDGTITGAKIQGSTLKDIPYAEIDELKTRNISASSIEAATGFVSTLASNSINATKIVANQGIIDNLETNFAHIENGVIDNANINVANVNGLSANYAHITNGTIDNAKIGYADVNGLSANYAHIANGVIDNAKIGYADVDGLSANYATIANLNAASGRIDDLEADHVSTTDLAAETARIDTLVANTADLATIRANAAKVTNLTAAELEADHATVGSLDTNYAQIDMANVNNAWIQNGTIKDAAISDGMINSVSANKLTAGTIDASNITVTNLNADNITTGTINGQRIGAGSISLDKLSEDVYTEAEVDAKLSTMQSQIDGAIETWTGTTVPTLQNSPASSWNTTALKDSHVGDVYFVVNPQSQQNGYNYRFTKSGSTYSWQLIKDSDVTNALQRLTTAEGKITTFDSDISQLKTDTGTLTTKTTSLETRMSNAEDDILDKVDTTTFNEVSDTVDSHSQSITQMSTTISNKADSSTVSSLTTRVSKNEQDISGINTKIGSLETTVENKADGSTVTSLTSRVNNISDTVDGHTSQLSSVQSTQTTIQGSAIKSTVQLWFTKANTTAPSKPTAHVTTDNAATANAWNLAVPTYNASYPNYYYCYEYEYLNGTYGWSAVTRDIATGEMQERARTAISNAATADGKAVAAQNTADSAVSAASTADGKAVAAQNTANKNVKESVQLWCTKASNTAPAKPTSAVTSTATTGNAWTTKVPAYSSSYPYYFYCMQYKLADGTYTWSDVVYDQATTEAQSVSRTTSSNLSTVTTKVNTISDTVDGHTSQLSATTTSLTTLRTDFDNLEIGGRNLLKNSDSLPGSSWVFFNATVSNGVATVGKSDLYENRIYQQPVNGYWEWEANTSYVLSVEARIVSGNGSLSINPYGANRGPKYVSITTEWVRYNYVFTSASNINANGSVSFYNNGDTGSVIQLRRPKFEKGNKPTDWSPAPEDLENYADNAANAVPRMAKINTAQRTFTTAQWKTYGTYGLEIVWDTGSSYNNSHLRVGDRAYLTGVISDQMKGTATIIGEVIVVYPSPDGTTSVTLKSEQLIFGGDAVSAIQTSLSETQTDYATFKQTTQNFESTIGSTYATKEELTTTVEQATQQYVDVETEPFIIGDDGISAPLRSIEANGWSEQFSTTGKNLLDYSKITTGVEISVSGGKIVQSPNWYATDYIPVEQGKTYIHSGLSSRSVFLYGSDKTFIERIWNNSFTIQEGTAYIRLNSLQQGYTTPQLELGSTATDYEPYTGGKPSPSPDYPQEIKVARGRNLLDESSVFYGYIGESALVALSNQKSFIVPCSDGVTYTVTKIMLSHSGDRYGLAYIKDEPANGVTVYDRAYIQASDSTAYAGQRISMTVTPKDGAKYIIVWVGSTTLFDSVIEQVQLTEGSTPQPYVPYGYVGLEVQGKNLLDENSIEQGGIDTSGNRSSDVNVRTANNRRIPVASGNVYSISGVCSVNAANFSILYYADEITNTPVSYTNWIENGTTFIIPNGANYARVVMKSSDNTNVTPISFSNVKLELGSTATDYEPYYHTTTPIPLPERGWVGSLPDGTADTLTIDGSGKVTWEESTEEVVFDGSSDEGWTYESIYNRVISGAIPSVSSVDSDVNHINASLSNVYKLLKRTTTVVAGNIGYTIVGSSVLIRDETNATSLSNWTTWLTTHNVTVLYPLATPVTEQCGYVNMPEVYPGCTISIPELDEVGISYWTPASKSLVDNTRLLEERVSNAETSIDQNKDQIALRAKSSDVYTKTQTDGLISTEVSNRNSAINQKADAITASVASTYTTKTEFNNLEIGGRNLVTSEAYCANDRTDVEYHVVRGTSLCYTSAIFETRSLISARSGDTSVPYTEENIEGETITISFEHKLDTNGISRPILLYPYQDTGLSIKDTVTFKPSTEWQKFTFTTKVKRWTTGNGNVGRGTMYSPASATDNGPRTNGAIYVYDFAGVNYYIVRKLKIEKGNKATDWTPAPEDVEAYTDAQVNAAKADIKVTTDNITSEVSKISSAKYVTSATASWSLPNIKTWSAEGYTGTWSITSSANLRVGDTVYIKGTDSTRNCPVYIKVTVTGITSNASITGISHGYEDVLPVETIKSTINQSSDSVKIQARHVEIDGAAIFTSISSDVDSAITSKGYATTSQVNTAKNEAISTAASDATSKANTAEQNAKDAIPTDISELNNDTGFITNASLPTKVSDLTNDSGFQTSTQVDTAITSKGYQTSSQVESAITSKGYQTSSQVESAITSKGYATTSQVNNAKTEAINSANSNTDTKLQSYSTTTQMNSAIGTAKTEAINAGYANYGYKYHKDIVIYGDSDKYYPVYFDNNGSDYGQDVPHDLLIKRSYHEQAPSDWYTSTHKGSLTLRVRWNYGGWGGATYNVQVYEWSEMYSTIVGDILVGNKSGMNSTIYLRGGGTTGALYHLYSDVAFDTTRYGATFPYIGTTTPGTVYMQTGTYTWTVDNPLTTPNKMHILSLAAVLEEQYIYISKASGTNSVASTETWVITSSDSQNTWTTKRPTYNASYPVLFVAKQKKTATGHVICTTPVKDDTTTIIDGGHITTGTIDASRVTVNNIDASKITTGSLSADRIKANVISAVNNGTGTINADKINASALSIGYSQLTNTPTIPTKVSQLTNDSSYATTTQLPTKVSQLTNDSSYATTTQLVTKSDKTHPDTRNDNQPPSWYFTNYPRQTIKEFKYANKIGIGSSSVYCTLETTVPWSDSSGGYPTQTTIVDKVKYSRVGTSASTWSPWVTDNTSVVVSCVSIDYPNNTASLKALLYIDGVATTTNVTYQWLKDGTAISGATSQTLAVTSAMGLNHVYSCTVTY